MSEWEPKTNLLYFISSAIKGHRNKILTNSFIQGMYYPLLTIEVLPIMGKLKHDKIEYKSCHICATEYEGYSCLGETCNQYFNRKKDRKFDIDALILINIEPEIYKLVQRCRCSVCGNIYDLIEQDIIDASLCNICKNPLFNKDRLISLWHNTHTMLQKAKVVEKERKPLIKCEYCFKEIDNRCWCPICNENNIFDKGGCLPQRMVQLFSRNMFGQMKSDF